MSTNYYALIFYGRLFDDKKDAELLMSKHNVLYGEDSIDSEDRLGFQYLDYKDAWALGFKLQPGVSDSYASQRWEHLFGSEPAQSLAIVDYY